MSTKFDPIRAINAELRARAEKLARVKVDTKVSSQDEVTVQLTAIRSYFRRVKINHLVAVKLGLWFKRMPLVDVIIDFKGLDAMCRNGQEAGEMAKLMEESMALVKQIMAHGLPRINAYCPEVGVVCNGWRFQC